MKRLLVKVLAPGVMLAVLFLAGSQGCNGPEDFSERNPWTNGEATEGEDRFHFAVVSDRTGAARTGVFPRAMRQLNLLRPAFVLSVGDLIQGYTEDTRTLNNEWSEIETEVGALKMPFFYVTGNHDLSNGVQERVWRKRFGRVYYHFVFRNVLFLALNADDPPGGGGGLSSKQIAFVRKVLKEKANVRWTIVVLHRPLWDRDDAGSKGWQEVENALQGRPYTVFAGHEHTYKKSVRHGRNYYQLATTGGSSDLRGVKYGEFDHFAWVTMEKNGPVIANVLVDGVLTDDPTNAATLETLRNVTSMKK